MDLLGSNLVPNMRCQFQHHFSPNLKFSENSILVCTFLHSMDCSFKTVPSTVNYLCPLSCKSKSSKTTSLWFLLSDFMRGQRLLACCLLKGAGTCCWTTLKIVAKLCCIQHTYPILLIRNHIVPKILLKHATDSLHLPNHLQMIACGKLKLSTNRRKLCNPKPTSEPRVPVNHDVQRNSHNLTMFLTKSLAVISEETACSASINVTYLENQSTTTMIDLLLSTGFLLSV